MRKNKDRYEEYPQVVYGNRKIKREILAYLKYLGCPSFRIILKDLGYTDKDTIYLNEFECLHKEFRDMEYLYSVNENVINLDNKITLNHGILFESPPYVSITKNSEEIKYQCVKSEIPFDGVWFNKDYRVKKYSNNKEYTRYYDMHGYFSSIVKDDYKLRVSLCGGYHTDDIIILDKEKELEEYLVSLDFPVKIDEVYKKICEIVGIEIDNYPDLKIEVSNIIDYNTTDIMQLHNGELVKFGMTVDNKSIFLDGDNNWSYKITKDDGKTVCYSLSTVNGNLDYNNNCSDNKDFQMVFSQNLNEAKKEVEKVKTRVRSMLNK